MGLFSRTIVIFALLAVSLMTGLALAEPDDNREHHQPMIDRFEGGIYVSPPLAGELRVMNVRVYDEQGHQVFNIRSFGEIVDIPAHELKDGVYKFEAVAVVVDQNSSEQRRAMMEQDGGEATRAMRQFGRFTIKDGLLLPDVKRRVSRDEGLSFNHIAGAVLDWLVPTAQAFDITETVPDVSFKDNGTVDPDADWVLVGDDIGFNLVGDGPGLTAYSVMAFPYNAPNIKDTLNVDFAGDVSLANQGFFFDRSDARIGIGTTSPDSSVDIHDTFPAIEFFDEDISRVTRISGDSGGFQLFTTNADNSGLNQSFSIASGAPSDSLRIFTSGLITTEGEVFVGDKLGVSTELTIGGRLGIGGIMGPADITILDPAPNIILLDSSEPSSGGIENDSGFVSLTGNTEQPVARFSVDAPPSSLVISSSGNANFGGLVRSIGVSIVSAGNIPRQLYDASNSVNGSGADWQTGINIGVSAPRAEFFIDNVQTDGSISVLRFYAGDTAGNQFRSLEVEADGDVTLASDTMTLQRAGNVGIGVSSPSSPLHIQRTDTAKIMVENTSAVEAPRELFELSNAGNTKFIITNTQAVDPSSWGFTNNGNDFRISYQGSGVVEMQVFEGGNVTIDGALTENSDRNAKANIRGLDDQAILDKVRELDIARWQYKDTLDADHIGPMAQDFHAAFGLGNTDTGISTLDTSGVALVAIQALASRNEKLEQQNQELKIRNEQLEQQDQLLIAGHRELLSAHHAQQQELDRLANLEQDQAELRQEQMKLQKQLSALIGINPDRIAMNRVQ